MEMLLPFLFMFDIIGPRCYLDCLKRMNISTLVTVEFSTTMNKMSIIDILLYYISPHDESPFQIQKGSKLMLF